MKKLVLAFAVITLMPFLTFGQNSILLPFQNNALPIEQRVEDLLSRMTLQEKVTQLFHESKPVVRLGIPSYNWWNECLHGVARAGKATVFPQAIGLAATFDQQLMFKVAETISDEARAKHHFFLANNVRSIYTGLTFWTPNINIFRDPRWGRGQETYGEDPYLTGKMAVNFINGLQGSDPKYFKTIATAKHYAVHSGPEYSRHSDNFFANNYDLFDTYLPAFEMTVKEANVQSVMCAYNRFRDQPCCGSNLLLQNILRDEFGFDGYVVSDCGAISDFYQPKAHNVVPTSTQAWGWSLSAGTDLNCEEGHGFLVNNLDSIIKAGVINEKDINTSLRRLLKARFMLGMFDPEEDVVYSKIPISVVGSAKHLAISQQSAEKSLILLKNDGILPLKNIKKVALIGPNANNFDILIGNYNGEPITPITPLTALRKKLGENNVFYAQGSPIVPGMFTDLSIVGAENLFHYNGSKLIKGLKAEYYGNTQLSGNPKLEQIDPKIDYYWTKSPINQLVEEAFAVRWTGVLVPQKTGTYIFGGNVTLTLNNDTLKGVGIDLEKGKKYDLVATYKAPTSFYRNNIELSASLTWIETSRDFRKEALIAAAKADVVIFCGGISAKFEGEEMPLVIDGFTHGDRTHINLPKIQEDLLKEIHKTGKPIVYVNFSGSAMALNWEDQNLPAIVQAFYPGETTGTALTRLLFGEYAPSGRLPITFYKSVDDLPDFENYTMENRTYRYFKGEPLYAFGHGLSYTTFAYSEIEYPSKPNPDGSITISATITNTGKMEGEEVAQLYLKHKSTTHRTPIHTLKGFQRINLKAGQSNKVTFNLNQSDLSITDVEGKRIPIQGEVEIYVGGCQPSDATVAEGKTIKATINL